MLAIYLACCRIPIICLPGINCEPTRQWLPQLFPSPQLRSAEVDAANKAAAHNDTPTAALFDVLGRQFLSVAHNRYQKNSGTVDEFYSTRTELDIEGNQLSVTDALGRDSDAVRLRHAEESNPSGQHGSRRTMDA